VRGRLGISRDLLVLVSPPARLSPTSINPNLALARPFSSPVALFVRGTVISWASSFQFTAGCGVVKPPLTLP
jgi:hypothetical protein